MHANTRLTPHSRAKLVEDYLSGKSMMFLAQSLGISRQTGYRWVRRFRQEGLVGLTNRSSRPHQLKYRLSARELSTLRFDGRPGGVRYVFRVVYRRRRQRSIVRCADTDCSVGRGIIRW